MSGAPSTVTALVAKVEEPQGLTRYEAQERQIEQSRERARSLAAQAKRAPHLEDAARQLKEAIDEDMLQIEASLSILQGELDRGRAQVELVQERVDQAREHVELVQERAQHVARHARHVVSQAQDWRSYVRAHPWRAVGISLALGFYLGSMLNS